MSKKLLTQKVVTGCIAGTDGGSQNAKFTLVLAIIMFVLGAIMALLSPVALLIFWAIAILILVLRAKNSSAIESVNHKKYILKEDVVISKRISVSTDGPDSYYLVFEKSGQTELHFPFAVLNSEAALATPDLYDTAEVGDAFYLLCTENSRILYMFNSRFWEISTTDFFHYEYIFVPRD